MQTGVPTHTNQLENSASSYLRSARHQPVEWHPWGEAAFARALHLNRPILLDIGAVWCHWCHVMDGESYEDPEIAKVINEHFIAVKVDRDERPDVDTRYQAAVSAISGQGGWPLTAFLTPDGRPYYGGTYFPRDDRYGRPGFGRVLLAMAQVWSDRRDEALETASSVMAAIEHNETFSGRSADLSPALIEKIATAIVKQFDPRNGGFGSQPKFPHPAALDLLLHVATTTGNEQAREAFTVTLEKMFRGGVYDQLAGGFHRYSVDERWVVPHFEKMLYDNTELLRNYVHGFQSPILPSIARPDFSRADFSRAAREIVAWLDSTMTDRDRGGFYASQDADVGLDDDGDYFTWTLDEARAVLSGEELEAAQKYWDIGELGDMHHNPAKNVLHINHSISELAKQRNTSEESLKQLLASARSKLLTARALRPTPFIDRTLYTGWNSMAVSAYLEAASAAGLPTREFALRTLDRLLAEARESHGAESLRHVIAYPDGVTPAEPVPGNLDDYAFTIHACIDAWLATAEMRYYTAAVTLADAMIARFYDSTAGAFYDSATPANAATLGALSARRKPLQDSPTPAGNPTAASALLRLEPLSGRTIDPAHKNKHRAPSKSQVLSRNGWEADTLFTGRINEYRDTAEDTLECFAGIVEHFGLYAGSYGLALARLLLDPIQIVIVGSGPRASELEIIAQAGYAANKTVIALDSSRLVEGGIPEGLAETLLQVPPPAAAEAWALVCKGRTCLPPITNPEALAAAINSAA
jgi:uncharacterized protein YyaL (SSP411 family)